MGSVALAGYVLTILSVLARTAVVCGGAAGWALYRIAVTTPGAPMLLHPLEGEDLDRYVVWCGGRLNRRRVPAPSGGAGRRCIGGARYTSQYLTNAARAASFCRS